MAKIPHAAIYMGPTEVVRAYQGEELIFGTPDGPPVSARIGNENPAIGDTSLPGNTGRAFMTKFSLPVAGTLNFVGLYSTSTGNGLVKGLVYRDSGGAPGALVAVCGPVNTVENAFVQSPGANQVLTPGDYWVGLITQDYLANIWAASSGGIGWAQWGDSNYDSPPNPWGGAGGAADYNVIAFLDYNVS